MGTNIPINFYERCRLCLERTGETDIFITEDLAEDIFICTSVKVSARDKLPPKICVLCLETIYSAKNLRTLAVKNNLHLLTLFGENDSSDESVSVTIPVSHNDAIDSSPIVSSSTSTNTADDSAVTTDKSSHRKRQDPLAEPEMECSVCQKVFYNKKKLYLHQRNHNKTLYCPLDACGKKFATKGDLEKHIRTHTGERPYICEVCKKSFAQVGTLKAHRETVHGDGAKYNRALTIIM